MTTVYYTHSFVPVELIAACGCVPKRLSAVFETQHCVQTEGMCAFTQSRLGAFIHKAQTETGIAVFATSCDQMRRAYDVYCEHCSRPAFLLNVPSTNTPNALAYYRQELERLAAFLCSHSGKPFDANRLQSPRRHQAAITEHPCKLAVVGETVSDSMHNALADILKKFQIEVGLDATDDKLVDHFLQFDQKQMKDDPFGALSSAYFRLPAIWKRPNHQFYRRLSEKIQKTKLKGVIVFRYVFCDVWHSGAFEMKKRLDVPVLQVDLDDGFRLSASAISRIQAFAEMLTR